MTQRFGKWTKYWGNGLDTWDTALVFEKRLYYVGLRDMLDKIWEMAQIHGTRLQYLRSGFTMLEMA